MKSRLMVAEKEAPSKVLRSGVVVRERGSGGKAAGRLEDVIRRRKFVVSDLRRLLVISGAEHWCVAYRLWKV